MEQEIQLVDYFEESLTKSDIFMPFVSHGDTFPRDVGVNSTVHSLPPNTLDKVNLGGIYDKTRICLIHPTGVGSFCQCIYTSALLQKDSPRLFIDILGVPASSSVGNLVSSGSGYEISFIFKDEGDAIKILKGTPIWVKLPSVPMELWSDYSFQAIGDTLELVVGGKTYTQKKEGVVLIGEGLTQTSGSPKNSKVNMGLEGLAKLGTVMVNKKVKGKRLEKKSIHPLSKSTMIPSNLPESSVDGLVIIANHTPLRNFTRLEIELDSFPRKEGEFPMTIEGKDNPGKLSVDSMLRGVFNLCEDSRQGIIIPRKHGGRQYDSREEIKFEICTRERGQGNILRVLGGQAKKFTLKRMIDLEKPEVIFVQENVSKGEILLRELKKLLFGWDFFALDANGCSKGLITGWSQNINLINVFDVHSGLCIEFFYKGLGLAFTLLNMYKPYEGKQEFWANLLSTKWIKQENLIIGGDLNLTLHRGEIWGSSARQDRLVDYFLDKFKSVGWVDVEPIEGTFTCAQFSLSLRRIKDKAVAWESERFRARDGLLKEVELRLEDLYRGTLKGIFSLEEKTHVRELEGRLIHEAIGTSQEGLHTIKNSHAPVIVIKLHLHKTFDRVSWLYLLLINVLASPFFKPTRGLKQGFPLSPYLFLLVAKVLNKAIKEAKRQRILQGIKRVGNGTQVRLGVDAIMGCAQNIFHPEALRQGGLTTHSLGLGEVLSQQWEVLLNELKKEHIRLKEFPDELVWAMNKIGGYYSVKLGYLTLQAPLVEVESWWWTKLWKVWKDLEHHLGFQDLWKKGTLDKNFHEWFTKRDLKCYKSAPYLVLWGI
eukprot:Gb_15009 [translate_table: standard]